MSSLIKLDKLIEFDMEERMGKKEPKIIMNNKPQKEQGRKCWDKCVHTDTHTKHTETHMWHSFQSTHNEQVAWDWKQTVLAISYQEWKFVTVTQPGLFSWIQGDGVSKEGPQTT